MVTKADICFPPPFQAYRGLTQFNPLYPMVFNVVVDSIIWYWVEVVAPMEAGAEGLGYNI